MQISLVAVLFFSLVIFGFAFLRTRKKNAALASLDWTALLAKIKPVPMSVVARGAIDCGQPGLSAENDLNVQELWELIGGADGIQNLYTNSEILLVLATHAQQWDPVESLIVTEHIRGDLIRLRKAVVRLSLGLSLGYDKTQGPISVQQALRSYYIIRERVLALYAATHVGRLDQLTSALK